MPSLLDFLNQGQSGGLLGTLGGGPATQPQTDAQSQAANQAWIAAMLGGAPSIAKDPYSSPSMLTGQPVQQPFASASVPTYAPPPSSAPIAQASAAPARPCPRGRRSIPQSTSAGNACARASDASAAAYCAASWRDSSKPTCTASHCSCARCCSCACCCAAIVFRRHK